MSAQIRVRKMMAVVAVLGVVVAAFRVHFSLGSFVAGVLSLAWIETAKWIRRREAAERPVGAVLGIAAFAHATAVAALVIVGSMIPVIVISPLLQPQTGCRRSSAPDFLFIAGPVCIYATIRIARVLQRLFGLETVTAKPTPDRLEARSEWVEFDPRDEG